MTDEQDLKDKVEQISESKQKTPESEIDNKLEEGVEKLRKLKEYNDRLAVEVNRSEELKARMALGGNSLAGQKPKTPEELANEEAAKLIKQYR